MLNLERAPQTGTMYAVFTDKVLYGKYSRESLAGKLPEDFIEGMSCEGGCVAGPGNILEERAFKRERDKQLKKADDRLITDTVAAYREFDFSMHRSV